MSDTVCVSIKAALSEKRSELFLILYLSNVSYVHIVKCRCVCAQNIPVGTVKWINSKKRGLFSVAALQYHAATILRLQESPATFSLW